MIPNELSLLEVSEKLEHLLLPLPVGRRKVGVDE